MSDIIGKIACISSNDFWRRIVRMRYQKEKESMIKIMNEVIKYTDHLL